MKNNKPINEVNSKVMRKFQMNNMKDHTVLQYDSPYNMKAVAATAVAATAVAATAVTTPSVGPSNYFTPISSQPSYYMRRPVRQLEQDAFQSYSKSISPSPGAQLQTQSKSMIPLLFIYLLIFFIITVYISRRRINRLELQLKTFQRNRINVGRNMY